MFHLTPTMRQFTCYLWVLLAMSSQVTLNVVSMEDQDINLHKRAQYYMRKLSETLEDMDSHSSRIQKRCASIPGFCKNLVEVTQQACPNYEIGSKDSAATATPDSPDLQTHAGSTVEICPYLVNATAKRIEQNNMIEVEFFVIHSSAVTVEIFMSFDSQKTTLDGPEKLETDTGDVTYKTSRVSFTFDPSTCNPNSEGATTIIGFLPVQKSSCISEVKMEICRLNKDIVTDTDESASDIRWAENEDGGKISQVFPVPRVRFSPDQGDKVLIEEGKNVSIEIEVLFYPQLELFVRGLLWNWTSNEEIHYRLKMEIKGSKIDIDDWNDENKGLVSVDILDETIVNTNKDGDEGDDGDDDDYYDEYREIVARIRITVNVASGDLSGFLEIVHSHEERRSRRRVCEDVDNAWYIPLKFPHKTTVLPLNTVSMYAESVWCDERGNEDRRMNDNHCILQCHAWGSDIQSIFITKSSHPNRPPVKSASFMLYDISASTMQDVGLASENNGGEYTCTVTFLSGETTSEEFSLTTNFTGQHLDN